MEHISQQDKEAFLLSLSEDDFRDKIVRRLFLRLGYADGRDLCGPEEFGKDAIFFERDPLGDDSLVALQTKKGNISLAASASDNLHQAEAQLRTALNTPFTCVRTKRQLLPTKVFLVASGRINEHGRKQIFDSLKDARLKFLDRDDLISKINDKCPEIWFDIVADVSPYLKAFADLVESYSVTRKDLLPSSGGIGLLAGATDSTYVDARLITSVKRIRNVRGKIKEENDFEEVHGTRLFAHETTRHLLIVGDAGSGKTTLLIRLAYLLAREGIKSKKNYRVPIYVKAGDLLVTRERPLMDALLEAISRLAGKDIVPFTINDLEEGRVALFVDGLDELADATDKQFVIDRLLQFSAEYPRNFLVLATRPYSSVERLQGIRHFKRYRVSPISLKDAEAILSKSGKAVDRATAGEILRRLDGVHGIELNPLLVTVFALTSSIDKRDLPANITELFSKFTELMLGRWDEKKGLALQYQARVKEHLLSAFCFKLHSERRTIFSNDEFRAFAMTLLSSMNLEADLDAAVSEVVERSGLIRGAGDALELKHHLLQEYFAGRGVSDLAFIKSVVNDEWWRNAIVFYFGSRPQQVDDLLDVATSTGTSTEVAHITVGLALQTCYLSTLDLKLDVWKWVVEAAGVSLARTLGDSATKYPLADFVLSYLGTREAVALAGIEKADFHLSTWTQSQNGLDAHPEAKRFWFLVGLIELGELEQVAKELESAPLSDNRLLMALHFGSWFYNQVRAREQEKRDAAKALCETLEPRVKGLMRQVVDQFRGQVLELRKGSIVALDQPSDKQ